MNLDTDYFLLLVDIKESTVLPNHISDTIMKRLDADLSRLNELYGDTMVIPLSVSYGDEIAGLFSSPGNIYDIIIALRQCLYPYTSIRFTITRGPVGRISSDIRKVGGIVFKKASNAMMIIKEKQAHCYWSTGNELKDRNLTSLSELTYSILLGLTEYQWKVYHLLQVGKSQVEIAKLLDKWPQSVNDTVKSIQAWIILEAEKTIHENLIK